MGSNSSVTDEKVIVVRAVDTRRHPGDTPESAAARLRNQTSDDEQFISKVADYAIFNVKYVNQPYETKVKNWQNAVTTGGDCSEVARLATQMYKSQGIDARVVNGITGDGYLHDTVEIHHNKRIRYFDERYIPKFTKIADGFGSLEVLEPESKNVV